MSKVLFRLLVILGIYMLVHSYWAVGELDMRIHELKNSFDEVKAKHNKLTAIVKILSER